MWDLIRYADSPVLSYTYWIRLCILIRSAVVYMYIEVWEMWSKASAGLEVRGLGALECPRQKELCVQRPSCRGAGYALRTEKRAGAQGWVGACSVLAVKRGVFQGHGYSNIAESQEMDWKMFDEFGRDFWLPFGGLFWWSNTGASQYEWVEQWVWGKGEQKRQLQ